MRHLPVNRLSGILVGVTLCALVPRQAYPQIPGTRQAKSDPFEKRMAHLQLQDQTFLDGLGKLNEVYDISFSIELIPTPKGARALPVNPKFTASIENKNLYEALDWLCGLDARFAWVRDGNSVNIFSRASRTDPHYLFNRILQVFAIQGVPDAQRAVMEAVGQLPPPKEQLAVLVMGGSVQFAKPWTATFSDITLRQAINRIALQLGPAAGWEFGGTEDFRFLSFHTRLGPVASPQGQK